ncbi:unnamed protein product [Ilex paraguariensis]|uniref:DUF7804 domain-containing protein n=1 Tax=Ilex paraguariensis TaxID=185542 RepID=A0ABC8QM30_9AQUA
MASRGIRCGRNHPSIHNHRTLFRIDRSNQISSMNLSFSFFFNHPMKNPLQRISASMPSSIFTMLSSSPNNLESYLKLSVDEERDNEKFMFSEKLDEWMRDSVVEIVKNLKEAPLLVHIDWHNNGPENLRFRTEKASSENWKTLKSEWERGTTPSPDGIIFVEKIEDERVLNEGVEEEETRVWGIVVQGKGVDCGPVCYLLKTSRVGVGGGLGLFCTHFLLVRIRSFSENALSQLEDCWLLQIELVTKFALPGAIRLTRADRLQSCEGFAIKEIMILLCSLKDLLRGISLCTKAC